MPGIRSTTTRPTWAKVAFAAWAILLGVVCLKPLFQPLSGTVYVTFARAGSDFLAGERLYDQMHPNTDNFRYSPLVAAGFAPFSLLPLGLGGALWRVLGAALLLTGLAAWSRRVCPAVPLPLILLAALPLSLGSLFNGQANTHILGLLLWAAVLACRGRWAPAAVLVAGAALFKGYPLAFGLLASLAAPIRFGVPLLLAVAVGLGLPFLLQSPDYVAAQYDFWIGNLSRNDRSGFPLFAGYQDFHMLLRVFGAHVPHEPYRLVQAGVGAAAAAAIGLQLSNGLDRGRAVLNALALGLCWMTLFGPSTESSTFILMTPLLARELVDRAGRPQWSRAAAFLGAALLFLSVFVFAFPHPIHRPIIALGVQPLGATLIAVAAVGRVLADRPARVVVEGVGNRDPMRRAA